MKRSLKKYKKGSQLPQHGTGATVGGAVGAGAGMALNLLVPGLGTVAAPLTGALGTMIGETFDSKPDYEAMQRNQEAAERIKYGPKQENPYVDNTQKNFNFPYGGTIDQHMMNPNAELELEETFQTPDGTVGRVDGPSHDNGGIEVNLPEGTRIFSDRLKHNGKTFAKLTKPITTKIANLEKKLKDNPQDLATANSVYLLNQQLDHYFDVQETNKSNEEMKRTLKMAKGGLIHYVNGGPALGKINPRTGQPYSRDEVSSYYNYSDMLPDPFGMQYGGLDNQGKQLFGNYEDVSQKNPRYNNLTTNPINQKSLKPNVNEEYSIPNMYGFKDRTDLYKTQPPLTTMQPNNVPSVTAGQQLTPDQEFKLSTSPASTKTSTTPPTEGFFSKNIGTLGQVGVGLGSAALRAYNLSKVKAPQRMRSLDFSRSMYNPNLVDYSANINEANRTALSAMDQAQRGFGSSAAAQAFKNKARLNQLEQTGKIYQGQENANTQLLNEARTRNADLRMREMVANQDIDRQNLENQYNYDAWKAQQQNAIVQDLMGTAGDVFGGVQKFKNQKEMANILAKSRESSVNKDIFGGTDFWENAYGGTIRSLRQFTEGGEASSQQPKPKPKLKTPQTNYGFEKYYNRPELFEEDSINYTNLDDFKQYLLMKITPKLPEAQKYSDSANWYNNEVFKIMKNNANAWKNPTLAPILRNYEERYHENNRKLNELQMPYNAAFDKLPLGAKYRMILDEPMPEIPQKRNGGTIRSLRKMPTGGTVGNQYRQALEQKAVGPNVQTVDNAALMDAEYTKALELGQDKYTSSVTGLDYKVLPKAEKRLLAANMWKETHGSAPTKKQEEATIKAIEGKTTKSTKANEVKNALTSADYTNAINKVWTPANLTPEEQAAYNQKEKGFFDNVEDYASQAGSALMTNLQRGKDIVNKRLQNIDKNAIPDVSSNQRLQMEGNKYIAEDIKSLSKKGAAVAKEQGKKAISSGKEVGKELIPTSIRALATDIINKHFGGNTEITEKFFTKSQLDKIEKLAKGKLKQSQLDKNTLSAINSYNDYNAIDDEDLNNIFSQWGDAKNIRNTLGRFNPRIENDTLYINETYDYNEKADKNKSNFSYPEWVEDWKKEGYSSPLAYFRSMGSYMGSAPGENNTRINVKIPLKRKLNS